MTTLTHLECASCGNAFEAGKLHNTCDCGGPLLARYDLENARQGWSREWLGNAQPSMWRYTPLLPVANPASIISLGEGMTPLVKTRRMGFRDLWIKDEGRNPTGSVKARGLSCAVSMALELGAGKLSITSSGHAAGALAAYAAAAGLKARVCLPPGVPRVNFIECAAAGAQLASAPASEDGWFDMTAWSEPYRLEGIKTLGFEIAEQMRWELPDVVICPTGTGMTLAGIWKAFEEMEAVGWISGKRPKMIAVQAEGFTLATGLNVPRPTAGDLIRKVLQASEGTAIPVTDAQMIEAGIELTRAEGIFPALEGAACLAALRQLDPAQRIVIINTGSGHKYLDPYGTRFPRPSQTQQDKLGGLITPR